jgi:hypothetical protein
LDGICDSKGFNQKDLASRAFESRRASPVSAVFARSILLLVQPNPHPSEQDGVEKPECPENVSLKQNMFGIWVCGNGARSG